MIRHITNDVRNAPWRLRVLVWRGIGGVHRYGYVVPIEDVATLKFKPDDYGSVVVRRFAESNQFKYKIYGLSNDHREGYFIPNGSLRERMLLVYPAGPSGIVFKILFEAGIH